MCIYCLEDVVLYTYIHNVSLHVYRNLVAMWHVLTGETQLLRMVFTNLLEVLSLSLPYQEKAKGQGRTTRVETVVPKAVSAYLPNISTVWRCVHVPLQEFM